jgi:putative ABC transport system permease protein
MISLTSLSLARRSLRARGSAFLATFGAIVLATALIGSFATLVETALASGTTSTDRETLITMGLVVGSWGSMIALFSLVSTIGIAVSQRNTEIALLRSIGSTPRQARRMIRLETFAVAVVGAALGAVIAWPGGAGLLALVRSSDLVATTIDYGGGPTSLGATAFAIVLVSLVSATVAGRKVTRGSVRMAIVDSQTGTPKMPKWRAILGVVLVAYGAGMAALTLTVMADSSDPYAPMQTSGSACIVVGVGLATLGPWLMQYSSQLLGAVLRRGGVSGYLAASNAARRGHLMAGVLGPVVVFTAATVGVLMMVGIDGRTLDAIAPDKQESQTITTLNYVVTGMIALFAALMVMNSLAAVIGNRRTEFAQLQLAGATSEQIRHAVRAESLIVGGVGLVLGLLASMATVVPYSVVRDEGVLPDGQLWLPAVVAVAAIAITVVGATAAARRTLGAVSEAGLRAGVAS